MLFLPVGITATKPLMLTHIAGIAYLDVSLRLLKHMTTASMWHNRIPWDLSVQNIRFWTYLELVYPNIEFASMSEHDIGLLYVECFKSRLGIDRDQKRFMIKANEIRSAVEHDLYVHPSSLAILLFWRQHLSFLGLDRDDIDQQVRFKISQLDILQQLKNEGLLINQQDISGSVYLDLTSKGLPLRTLVSEIGEINYFLPILRDLYSQLNKGDEVVLFHDDSVEQDYVYLEKLLTGRGVHTVRKKFFRVPVEGVLHSSKAGGWEESTFAYIRENHLSSVNIDVARLATKRSLLYGLGQKGQRSFNTQIIEESLKSAEQTLQSLAGVTPNSPETESALLRRFVNKAGLVNMHGLFTYFENKRTPLSDKASILSLLI